MAARNQLSKMLLGEGLVYPAKTAWIQAHRAWLCGIELPFSPERLVMSEHLQQVITCE